ncbi:hypothetical protein M3672_09150 [Microbacterium enclense]|uniref:hypothetical protein n=1 Tax=Microbacterium enclense TaxID=993073 RepID=UPI00203B04E2|nr:hypothetical protein [Microbacterium enclense]MCM3614602.1 hypothetical protein [Microbacterium enclense]
MPVLDPNKSLDAFLGGVVEMETRYADTYQAVSDHVKNPRQLQLRKGLAADFAFRLGSEWELFQHKWHVVAVTSAPDRFVTAQQASLDAGVKKASIDHYVRLLHGGALTVPSKPKQGQVEALLDPRGYNVTFESCETWMTEAARDLDSRYSDKVRGIVATAPDACVLDLLKGIRNALAHGSGGSLSRLNELVKERPSGEKVGLSGSVNDGLKRDTNKIRDVAVYLHGRAPGSAKQRVQKLAQRVREIAEQLRV